MIVSSERPIGTRSYRNCQGIWGLQLGFPLVCRRNARHERRKEMPCKPNPPSPKRSSHVGGTSASRPCNAGAAKDVGPPYIKLSKAVRYPVDDIVAYEQANRQGMPNDAALPPLTAAPPVVEPPPPSAPEPKRYYLNEAFALIAQYGSLEAAEAALTEARDEAQG